MNVTNKERIIENEDDFDSDEESDNPYDQDSSDQLNGRKRANKLLNSESVYSKNTTKKIGQESASNINNLSIFGIIIALVLVTITFYIQKAFTLSKQIDQDYLNTKCFIETFHESNDICSKQKNTCNIILKGIRSAVNNQKRPYIFVLVAHSSEQQIAECLSFTIANLSSCALNTTGSLILTSKGLSYKTSEIIDKFEPKIKEFKSVIFIDLLKVNVEALLTLHNFCDVYNPLVTPAVYTIVIITDKPIDYYNHRNVTKTVKQLLETKFNGNMDKNKIYPLITRITDGPILPLLPGKIDKDCLSLDHFNIY